MYGVRTAYVVEPANHPSGREEYRITTTLEGPHADLREHRPRDVATLSREQAERLRDELDEVLP